MKKKITISQGLTWQKTLRERHVELLRLRNENARRVTNLFGDEQVRQEPLYDPIALDKLINNIAKELRLLDEAIKATNAKVLIEDYERDDEVVGELVPFKKETEYP